MSLLGEIRFLILRKNSSIWGSLLLRLITVTASFHHNSNGTLLFTNVEEYKMMKLSSHNFFQSY